MRFSHFSMVGAKIVLAMPLTKIAQRRGQKEFIAFDCPIVALLLRRAASTAQIGDLLVPCSAYWFRQWWKEGLRTMQLDCDVFKPYSIRRGAASWRLRTVGSLEFTVFRGR